MLFVLSFVPFLLSPLSAVHGCLLLESFVSIADAFTSAAVAAAADAAVAARRQ